MYKYIYVETKEIRETVTTIPQEMWAKKGLLPYELNVVKVEEGSVPPIVGFDVQEDKIVETKIKWIPKPKDFVLSEYIEEKVEQSKLEVTEYINKVFSPGMQLTALSTIADPVDAPYTLEEAKSIILWCRTKVKNFVKWKDHIRTLTVKEDIDNCSWITRVYDDDTQQLVSESFWGE